MSSRRGSGPKRGPRITKFIYVFWNDCKVPCGDDVNFKKILGDPTNLQKGSPVNVKLSKDKDSVHKGTVLELGKLFLHFFFHFTIFFKVLLQTRHFKCRQRANQKIKPPVSHVI